MNLSRKLNERRTSPLLPPLAQRAQDYAQFFSGLTLG